MKFMLIFLTNIIFVFCNSLSEKMKAFDIVPDVIDVAPQKPIKVSFL